MRCHAKSAKLRLEILESRNLLAVGDLDVSFGTGGLVVSDFGVPRMTGIGAVLQADGKILVAGAGFELARYNTDGTLKRHPDGTSFVDRYVKLFDKAGGEFGSAVSWHAHGAVRFKSLLGTNDLVTTLAATKAASLPI